MQTQNGFQQFRTPALVLGIAAGLAVIGLMMFLTGVSASTSATASGVVVDAEGPVSGATVRVRATDNVTRTNASGQFTLASLVEGLPIEVTAWADGYYIASTHVTPTIGDITLTLRPYHQQDHPEYAWVSPISGTSDGACGNCHPMIVSQWITNAHGLAVSNPRFFSLYNGTNLSGTVATGPGYVNDFPGTAGTCANCHAPGLGVDGYLTTDMNAARDVITAGIHCDYCHKIGGVYLNPATQSVYPNVPGAQSTRLLRPPPGDNVFFGPYDDVHDPDTYLPAMAESQYCAPCHQFSFWGTPIYESYGEWLASPYAEMGVTCQACHMPPNGDTTFALPEVGGLEHPPDKIPSHLDLGARSLDLLQNSVTMTLDIEQAGALLSVTVTITNTKAGHHVPTDFPGRHLILTVVAEDGAGQALPLQAGPLVPAWGGAQAGLPGKAFAKVLRDVQTGEAPVVSYWKQTLIASDNRIPALGRDRSVYGFGLSPGGGPVTVTAELRFRRAFQAVMDAKGWQEPDILMEQAHLAGDRALVRVDQTMTESEGEIIVGVLGQEDSAIAGHSFGGLFALYALLQAPGTFSRYIISSPSIWWDPETVFESEAVQANEHSDLPAKVFISAGSLEESMLVPVRGVPARFVTNMQAMATRLQSRGYRNLALTQHIFEDESHVSGVPGALSRGLRVVFGP